MKTFKNYLTELNKPKHIDIFKNRVKSVTQVGSYDDNRDKWIGTMDDLFDEFGFKNVGRGKYATVFANPKYPYAIKLFMKDTAYLKYLHWVMKNQRNKFVPKVRGKVIKINDTFMAVRIEKLEDFYQNSTRDLMRAFEEMCLDPEDFIEGYSQFKEIPNDDKDAIDLCKFLISNRNLLDIHSGNIMSRKKQPVLVDPFYNWYKGGRYTMDPDDISHFKEIF